ncbi:hypothetical protein COJ85_08940 [Bacillus sp. AFS076308]|uniref:hypothetical protein n=1 Tax=unclassified Bacillus (in: firmicutes) TaxID=185979 RepID=UPI000BF9AC8A|nr:MULTISPECIES: hypothetical protein [unclassified Bacillus (in: firmicutes)]PFO05796.1 hypothetical protein COJ85_08940 [Bacillus sp. AFS076308]PGV54176.1 hypothetical protein COD92_05955 [Bacillus sp. AFS037270]
MHEKYPDSKNNCYQYFGDLVLIKTQNSFNGKNFFCLDREIFQKYKALIIKPRFKTIDDYCRVYVTSYEGVEVPLHRILSNPIGNNEVTLLNDDPSDLRMVNFWETTKGKIARSLEEKKLQARWITPIDEYLQEIFKNPFR